jgi:hypothetical protein
MSFLWLIAWLIAGLPHLSTWNGWLIALIVCLALDACTGGRYSPRRSPHQSEAPGPWV